MRLFDRSPGIDAATYAEAQALVDDGLERALVLELYPDDVEWLGPLLSTSLQVRALAEAEAPSYYFEATLKAKFLAAAAAQQAAIPATVAIEPMRFGRLRAAAAGALVLAAAGLVSFISLGFITADKSVPGDWNYVFRRTNERLDYTLSSGNNKIDVQLNHTEQRVYEIQQQQQKGTVSQSDLQRLQGELDSLTQAVSSTPPSPTQKDKLTTVLDSSVAVLSSVKQQQAPLAAQVDKTIDSANTAAVAAGLPGGVTPLVTPTPSPSPAPSGTPAGTPTATSTAASNASATASATSAPATNTATTAASTATPGATGTPKASGTAEGDSAH